MLRIKGYDVSISPGPVAAIKLCKNMSFYLIITDQRMPVIYGSELATVAKHLQPATKIILISGSSERMCDIDTMMAVDDYVQKPRDNSQILEVINEMFKKPFTAIG